MASYRQVTRTQRITHQALTTIERFMHVEALSGVVLLVAAAAAFIWANSGAAGSYDALWNAPLSVGFGDWHYSQPLHFWINDAVMTLFFLVVGMEIRREMHSGALTSVRQAALPIAAAIGGVTVPALIYVALNQDAARLHGWAVPTATDIAFAVGVLALLGRRVPGNVRVFLLTLAIIDDIVAVLIIAIFYSGGLQLSGFLVAGVGVALVLVMQAMGIGRALLYVVPGAVLWVGLLMTGAHPTLAGVVLGLMTPVVPTRMLAQPLDVLKRVTSQLATDAPDDMTQPLRQLRLARRELLPPVVRVQMALHPWVAFGVMPLFALANAGVAVGGLDLAAGGASWVVLGVALALVAGKPLGVVIVTWVMLRLGIGRLPDGVTWSGVLLVGLLAGIGFTMSIFIANLAFEGAHLLGAAKLGVLLASVIAAVLGLAWGAFSLYGRTRAATQPRA